MVTKSREFINLNLNCIRTTTLKCKVFDIIICLNHFSINLNFKLKRKSRHDYQIKYAFISYGHMSCKISFAKSIAFMTMVNKFAQLKNIEMRQT